MLNFQNVFPKSKAIDFTPPKLELNIDSKSYDPPKPQDNSKSESDQISQLIIELEQDLHKVFRVEQYIQIKQQKIIDKLHKLEARKRKIWKLEFYKSNPAEDPKLPESLPTREKMKKSGKTMCRGCGINKLRKKIGNECKKKSLRSLL
jgi:hypothetical protein